MLRNKKTLILIILFSIIYTLLAFGVFKYFIKDGSRIDYYINDYSYSTFLGSFVQIPVSDQIVYLIINDDTYKYLFKSNTFNRKVFARSLKELSKYNPQAVIIDIIFAYESESAADDLLSDGILHNNTYLPISFALSETGDPSSGGLKVDREPINQFLVSPLSQNYQKQIESGRYITQLEEFMLNAKGIGHISDYSDDDGIVRHSFLFIPVDSMFLPSLYLKAYLDYVDVPADCTVFNYNEKLIVPALEGSWLNESIHIPVDIYGRTLIPFVGQWRSDFPMLSLNKFMELSEQRENRGVLTKFFEGKFVVVGDVSTGIADLASTSVDKLSPLITIQSNMLNALLSNKFISKISPENSAVILIVLVVFLMTSALFANQKIFYRAYFSMIILLLIAYIIILSNLYYIPITSILIAYIVFGGGLLVIIEGSIYREKKVIEVDNLRRSLEMDGARKIQLSMLPQIMPRVKGLKIAAYLSTASEVGGDYYDFYLDDSDRLRIIIGDATGHGLKAGTMVTIVKTLFATFREYGDLKEMFNKMSSIIKGFKLNQLFICLSIFVYDSGKFRFTSAGMPPVIIYRHKLKITDSITLKGLPLGVWDNFPYETAEFILQEGDAVLLSSDGLMELFNKDNEMLGLDRIEEIFCENGEKDPDQIIEIMKQTILNWTTGTEPQDDITILVIKASDNDS